MATAQDRPLHHFTLVILLLTSSSAGAQIRLAGSGSTRCSGRVEVYHNNQWGTVCDDNWGWSDANVVCRQLNCGTIIKNTSKAEFGEGTGQIWLDEVGCSGSESSLTQCAHRGFGVNDCNHGEDAGVICSDHIRLVGPGSTLCSGRVEVFHNSEWGTVCDDSWDMSDAQVVCRHLECGTALGATGGAQFGRGSSKIWLDDVGCSGSERSLTQCTHRGFGSHDCKNDEDAGVVCSGSIPKPSISVSPSRDVMWGKSVDVSCSITGLSGGTFVLKCLDQDVQTLSSNPATFNLPRVTFENNGPYHCLYSKDVSGQTLKSSRSDAVTLNVSVTIPKPRISVSPSREVMWGHRLTITCSIQTEHLGGTFILRHSNQDVWRSTVTPTTFNVPQVNFDHDGAYHCLYQKDISGRSFSSPQSDSVTLKVTVSLPLPSLSVSSPDGGQQWTSGPVHITRGHSFVLSSSVHSHLPPGLFVLTSSGSNSSFSQSAANHSASFFFTEARSEHQGEYNCVYQVTGARRTYTSPKSTIHIVITLPLVLVVGPSVAGGLLLLALVFLLVCLILKKRSRRGRSKTIVQIQMPAANQYVEDSDEDEADYVNVDEPKGTKNEPNYPPMRSNPYTAPTSLTPHSKEMASNVRFVKTSETCCVEGNSGGEDSFGDNEDDDNDYENVTEANSEENIYQNS